MKLIITCMEGYSASSQSEADSIIGVLKDCIKATPGLNYVLKNFESSEVAAVKHATEWVIETIKDLKGEKFQLLFIGKSMGGAKTFFLYKRLHEHHRSILQCAQHVSFFTVDPHGSCNSDWNPVPFSSLRPMKIELDWKLCDMAEFINIYQWEKYPKGAKMERSDFNLKLKNTDHFAIIHRPEVSDKIKEVLGRMANA